MAPLTFVYVGMLLSAMLAVYSFYAFQKNEHVRAILCLTLSGIVIRFCVASADPYLYDWDEKFHALVAKNMGRYPFKPMLY